MQVPEPLNEQEAQFAERLRLLFAQVHPQQPEKGVQTLLLRARREVETTGRPLNVVLEELYQGARERTERRVRLLSQCSLTTRNESKP